MKKTLAILLSLALLLGMVSISESIEPATIIFATLPILVVYPFVQRYFVAGVTIGAVKG